MQHGKYCRKSQLAPCCLSWMLNSYKYIACLFRADMHLWENTTMLTLVPPPSPKTTLLMNAPLHPRFTKDPEVNVSERGEKENVRQYCRCWICFTHACCLSFGWFYWILHLKWVGRRKREPRREIRVEINATKRPLRHSELSKQQRQSQSTPIYLNPEWKLCPLHKRNWRIVVVVIPWLHFI